MYRYIMGYGELSKETIRDIEQSLEDVKAGRTMSMKEVKQKLKKE